MENEQPVPSASQIASVVRERVARSGAPGAQWALVRDEKIEASGATGVASSSTGRALTPDTPMQVGSVSKPITAAAVMQLVERGLVELDKPVATYLPWFTLADSSAQRRMTVRQLLSHTSGFGTVQGNRGHDDLAMDRNALRRRITMLADTRPAAAPGARWQYSNINYQLLGALIEQVTGTPYARYVESEILGPLGMADSYVTDEPAGAVPARGHRMWFGQVREMKGRQTGRATGPQGGIVASAPDLGKFMAMMMNGRDDILTARSKAAMMTPQSPAERYGLGWFVRTGSPPLVYHLGDNPGFSAVIVMDPQRRLGFAMIANLNDIVLGRTTGLTLGSGSYVMGAEDVPVSANAMRLALFVIFGAVPIACLAYGLLLFRGRHRPLALSTMRFALRLLVPTGVLLALAAAPFLTLPGLFGAPVSAGWTFAPDFTLLVHFAAGSLIALALARALILSAREKRTRTAQRATLPRP